MTESDGLRIADRKHIGLAEMLKGGVIMDVTTAEQAKIAEDAGAASVMALERHGLKPDESVVVRGNEILRDGQPVRILK